MGYSLSWAALKGGALEVICDACNLHPTVRREEIAESKIDAAEIPPVGGIWFSLTNKKLMTGCWPGCQRKARLYLASWRTT